MGPTMIFTMHGVVALQSSPSLSQRWLLDADEFDSFVSRRKVFEPLDRALRDEADALTIDDATQAAYHAAMIARRHGHAVTLFINSRNVHDMTPYYLHVLSAILDNAPI